MGAASGLGLDGLRKDSGSETRTRPLLIIVSGDEETSLQPEPSQLPGRPELEGSEGQEGTSR